MTITIPTPADFSFRETVHSHGWRQLPPFVWDEDAGQITRWEAVDDGPPVLLHIREADSDRLSVSTDRPTDSAALTARVRRMLLLDLDLTPFHDYCRTRPELGHIPARRQGRLLRSPTLWEDAVKVIATTNTTWAQTKAMVSRLIAAYGAEGKTFPTPARIARVPLEEFAETARWGYRNASLHRLATLVTSGELDLESYQDAAIPTPDLRKRLLALPGVGPYAAACLLLYLGRSAHVNVDSWARTLVGKELGRRVTDQEAHAFFDSYGEWRGLVYTFYAWKES